MTTPVPLRELHCPLTSATELIERYEVLLLDAFGVLVHTSGAIAGAAQFLERIAEEKKEFLVVTNDASRLPSTCSKRFAEVGLHIAPEQFVTSGTLLAPFFQTHGLQGSRCIVLGPPDSKLYVQEAGGEIVPPTLDVDFDVLVICDDAGFDFLPVMDDLFSNLCRHMDRGKTPMMVLPNPDLIYPRDEFSFGFTAGGVALLLETALAQRYPQLQPKCIALGKPHSPMYEEVLRRVPTGASMVMIGDQIDTDIVGARSAGIDAVLVDTGIAKWDQLLARPHLAPTYRLPGFRDLLGTP